MKYDSVPYRLARVRMARLRFLDVSLMIRSTSLETL